MIQQVVVASKKASPVVKKPVKESGSSSDEVSDDT